LHVIELVQYFRILKLQAARKVIAMASAHTWEVSNKSWGRKKEGGVSKKIKPDPPEKISVLGTLCLQLWKI